MMPALESVIARIESVLSSGGPPVELVVISVLVACVVFQAWCVRRLQATVETLLPLEDRMTRLTRSVTMLADATEGCFTAVSSQLDRSDDTPSPRRQPRPRRATGAARRGRSAAQIAAEEEVAEGEVALRMRLAQDLQNN